MNKFLTLLMLLPIFSISLAHMDEGFIVTDSQMADMMQRMMGGTVAQPAAPIVNCSTATEEDFELYGDALMERMIGDHNLHESMDAYMGEQAARIMHVNMGAVSLGCSQADTTYGGGFGGMMTYMMLSMVRAMAFQQTQQLQQTQYVGGLTWDQLIVAILILGFAINIYMLYEINRSLERHHRK